MLPRSHKHRLFAFPSQSIGGSLRSFYDMQPGEEDLLQLALGETTETTQELFAVNIGADVYKVFVDGVYYGDANVSEGVSITVTGLTSGTVYRYRIEAYTDDILVSRSKTVSRRTVSAEVPDQIMGLSLTPGFPPFLEAEWSDPADPSITDYSVNYRVQGAEDFDNFQTGSTELAAAINSLDPVTTYEVAVAGINENGQGEFSDLASATTVLAVAPIPLNLSEMAFDTETVQPGTVFAEWEHPANIQYYGNWVYSVRVDDVENMTTTDPFAEITGLDNGTEYDITVHTVVTDAEDVVHTSDPSNLVSMKTLIFLDIFTGGNPGDTLAGTVSATGHLAFIETGAAVFNKDTGIGAQWDNDGSDTLESTVFWDSVADRFRCRIPACFTKGHTLPISFYFNYDRNTLDGWKLTIFSGKWHLYRLDAGTPTEVATQTGPGSEFEYPDDSTYVDFLVDNNFISGVFTSSVGRTVPDLVYDIADRPYKTQTAFGFGIYGGDLNFDDGGGGEILHVEGTINKIIMSML